VGRVGSFRARTRAGARGALAGALLVALTFGVLLTSPASTAAADEPDPSVPLKVLVIGDSISHGFAGDSTWRYWFWRETRRQGVPIDFVGPDRLPYLGPNARYEKPGLYFDRDHAARGGSTVNYHLARIDDLMETYAPHVVVVEIGINDLAHGDTAVGVVAETETLLARIWQHAATARVVLAELPSFPADAAVEAQTVLANKELAVRYGADPRVLLAKNRSGTSPRWQTAQMTSDGLHPNATGQTLLAQRFAEAFHRGGYLPQPPSLYRVRSWQPGVAPRVRRSGQRLTVDWSASLTEVKLASVRVLITRPNGTRLRGKTWFSAGVGRIHRTLPRGTWYVRLVPVRGTMQGVPVPATVVRIP
jgi:lysophospholipase L1-like esterase